MAKSKWRKAKISFGVLTLLIVIFFCLFNTSTRWGRWLYWQGPSWVDVDRFAWRTVDNDPSNIKSFDTADSSDRIIESSIRTISDFRIEGQSIIEFANQHDSTALIVAQGNSILLEKYFRGLQRDSLQLSFSVTKSIASLLVGIAIDEGLIESVDDPISRYVNGLNEEFSRVTIRHLMTMTSGISDKDEKLFDVVPAPWCDEVKAYYDPNLRHLAKSFTITNEPGETFEYHDFNPVLIAMMLENVTGGSLADYLSKKIWQPVGMSYPARWSLDSRRHGLEKPESGLNFPAIDYARLGAMLLDEDQTIVSQNWLEESTRPNPLAGPQDRLVDYADERLAAERISENLAEHIRSIRYGLYWWVIERKGRRDFYANGHFGQFIYVSPAANLVIIRCGKDHGGLNDYHFGNAFFRLASNVIAAKEDITSSENASAD